MIKFLQVINLEKSAALIFICFFIIQIFNSGYCYTKNEYTVVADNNYPPHIFLNEKKQPDGFDYEALKLIEKVSGLKFKYHLKEWNTAKSDIINGSADILVGMNKTKEREKFYDFSREFFRIKTVMFINKKNSSITKIEDIYDKRVAVQKGDLAEEFVSNYYPHVKLITFANQIDALNALKNEQVDVVVGNFYVGLYWVNKFNFSENIKVVGKPLLTTSYCLAVKKGQDELLSILNKSILRILDNGELENLRDKWFAEGYYYSLWFEKNTVITIIKYVGVIAVGVILVSWIIVFFLKKRISNAVFELKGLNRYYKALIENASDVIIVIKNNGIISYISPSFIKLLGYSVEDLVGKNIYGIIHPLDLQIAVSFFSEKNSNRLVEIRFIDKQGTYKILETSISNLHDDPAISGFVINARDITERINAEQEIQMLAQTIRNISECVCVTDTRNKILFVNEAFLKTYGYSSKEDVINKNISLLYTPEVPASVYIGIYQATLRGGWQGETILKKSNGNVFPVYVSTAIVYDNKEEPLALVAVTTDITERKISELELINAKEEAEKSNKLKSEFLAQISHEIRTPVNTILSFTSLLKEELESVVPDDIKSSFSIIENGGRRLIRTIDMILNMSEIQAGNYEINLKEIDIVKDILNRLIPEFQNTADSKNLDLIFECNEFNPKIIGDQYTLTQMFQNLVDNAIKYTPSGCVKVSISNIDSELSVEIKDTGIGISKEYLPYLFEAFSQEETGYTRRFEGNGLGLSLVKKYAEMNNAVIKVQSEKGHGSTFTVTFKTLEPEQSENSGN